MDCLAVLLTQNPHAHRKRCRTRCFDSTMFHIVHGSRRDLLHISNKKRTSYEMRCFFKMVVGDGFDGGRKPDVREHRSPKGEKRKATTLKESTPGCEADG